MTKSSSPVPAPELTGWMAIPLEHTRSCQHWNDDGCTCALEIRIAARNWMELHNAWRKRAEEAEAEVSRLRSQEAELKQALEIDGDAAAHFLATISGLRSLVERMEADTSHLDWLNERYIGADFHYDWAGEEMSVMLIRIPVGKRVSADLRDTVRRLSQQGDTKE